MVAPLAGLLSDRIEPRLVLASGMLLQGAGLIWVAALAATSADYPSFIAPLVVAGVGISMALPVAPAAALSAVPPADLGKASGINSTLQRFGSAFGVAIATAVFTANGRIATPARLPRAFARPCKQPPRCHSPASSPPSPSGQPHGLPFRPHEARRRHQTSPRHPRPRQQPPPTVSLAPDLRRHQQIPHISGDREHR